MSFAGIIEAMANPKKDGSIHLTQRRPNEMQKKYLPLQLNAYSLKEKLASTEEVLAVLLPAILPANTRILSRF